MTELGAERFSWREFYKECERGILIAFSIVVFFAIAILRLFHYADFVCLGALGAIVFGWLYVAFTREEIGYTAGGPLREARLTSTRVLGVISVLALSSFFAVSSTFDGFIVSGSQYKSTLTQPVLFFVPIFNDLKFVPLNLERNLTNLEVDTTADNVPVVCSVSVSGIFINTFLPYATEQELFVIAPDGDFSGRINADLDRMIVQGFHHTFDGKSSTEIADARNTLAFKFGIVRGWYDLFPKDILHWREATGAVSYSCELGVIDHRA